VLHFKLIWNVILYKSADMHLRSSFESEWKLEKPYDGILHETQLPFWGCVTEPDWKMKIPSIRLSLHITDTDRQEPQVLQLSGLHQPSIEERVMLCQAQCTVYVESTLAPCLLLTSNNPCTLSTVYVESTLAPCLLFTSNNLAPCSLFTSNQPLHLVLFLRRINPCTLFTVHVESTLAHCSLLHPLPTWYFPTNPTPFYRPPWAFIRDYTRRLRTDHFSLSVTLNTHLKLVSRSRISRSMHPFPHKIVGQWFSTFVRPRSGKFFFYKTRARSQQIYS
jgi:hypothetical protein